MAKVHSLPKNAQPIRTLNRVVSGLGLLIVLYACFFSLHSYHDEKNRQLNNSQNIIQLSVKTIDETAVQIILYARGPHFHDDMVDAFVEIADNGIPL